MYNNSADINGTCGHMRVFLQVNWVDVTSRSRVLSARLKRNIRGCQYHGIILREKYDMCYIICYNLIFTCRISRISLENSEEMHW